MAGLDNVVGYVVKDDYVIGAHDIEDLLRAAPLPMISARIKRARKTKGWSHDRLGVEMGGVHRQNLIGYENGRHRPRLATLERIAEATGRDVRWFVDPDVDESPFQEGQEAA